MRSQCSSSRCIYLVPQVKGIVYHLQFLWSSPSLLRMGWGWAGVRLKVREHLAGSQPLGAAEVCLLSEVRLLLEEFLVPEAL